MQEWQEWQQVRLDEYSPNQAPSISDAESLQLQVLPG
jgi:hypothetical protein